MEMLVFYSIWNKFLENRKVQGHFRFKNSSSILNSFSSSLVQEGLKHTRIFYYVIHFKNNVFVFFSTSQIMLSS